MLIVGELERRGETASRAAVQRWVEAGRVLVYGRPCKASALLAPGTEIDVDPSPEPATTVTPNASVVFRIVFEDAHLIVVDKPAGLVVHPARGNWEGTLVHGLAAHGLDLAALADPDREGVATPPRPGIVHRLDKGTSGLLVVAKSVAVREGLKLLFASHDIEREYVALVVGKASDRRFDTLHGRSPGDRTKFTSRGAPVGAKRAITTVRVLEALAGTTLVACTLETGRTHQIRVHLAEQMKTPVLGDPAYGERPLQREIAVIGEQLGHQALHARVLGFVHPITKKRVRFESDPPADFQAAVSAARALGARVPKRSRTKR
jgi:23S rRNA pseudouridine1911/1915/1917 synthase